MKITETAEKVVIRDLPLGIWIWGTIFAIVFGGFGVFTLYSAWIAPHDFIGSSGQSIAERGLTISMFAILVLFVLAMVFLFVSYMATPVITTTIERGSGTVLIRRRGLWRDDGERYLVSEVKEFGIEIPPEDGSSRFAVLILRNDRRIRVVAKSGKYPPELIARLNAFIGKTDGSAEPA